MKSSTFDGWFGFAVVVLFLVAVGFVTQAEIEGRTKAKMERESLHADLARAQAELIALSDELTELKCWCIEHVPREPGERPSWLPEERASWFPPVHRTTSEKRPEIRADR